MKNNMIKKLKIIGSLYHVYDAWNIIHKIVDHFSEIKIIKVEWADSWKRENPHLYPLDLSKIETWSTYRRCVECSTYLENDMLLCDFIIYEGDFLDGNKKQKRFSASLELPIIYIEWFKDEINRHFESYLVDKYHEEQEYKRQLWMKNYSKALLKD